MAGDEEPVLAGMAYERKTFEPTSASPSPLLPLYRDALVAAGWKVIDTTQITPGATTDGNISLSAHYVEHGQTASNSSTSVQPSSCPSQSRRSASSLRS